MTRIKGISVLLLETPLTRSKYIFPPHTHTQTHTTSYANIGNLLHIRGNQTIKIPLHQYVKDYRAAGKVWLDTVVEQKEQSYDMLYDKLQQLDSPHIVGLDQADKEQVFKCIRDRTGRFLTQDGFVLYIETEEEIEKPRYSLTGKAKEVLKDYYDAVHMLCEAQTNFAKSTGGTGGENRG